MASIRARKPHSLRSNGLACQVAYFFPAGNHLCEYLQLKWKHDKKLILITDPFMRCLYFCKSLQQILLYLHTGIVLYLV